MIEKAPTPGLSKERLRVLITDAFEGRLSCGVGALSQDMAKKHARHLADDVIARMENVREAVAGVLAFDLAATGATPSAVVEITRHMRENSEDVLDTVQDALLRTLLTALSVDTWLRGE